MKKKVFFIALTAVIFIVTACFFLFGSGGRADIYLNGKLLKSVSLSNDCEFIIEADGGYNKIVVSGGKIGVCEADCPDKTCVKTGMTDNSFLPIICIPHRLEIIVA